jgi:hypothetical protein
MTGYILTEALGYAERGLLVCPCGSDKRPIGGWPAATADVEKINELWETYPDANVGLATGREAGLIVLDIDEKRNGDIDSIERRFGPLPETWSVTTGAGQHYYFAHPDMELHGSYDKLADGVEVKAYGQGVIAPASLHSETGRRYCWENSPEDTELAPAPQWLIDHARVTEQYRANGGHPLSRSVHSVGSVTPDSDIEGVILSTLPRMQGERNRMLFKLARRLKAFPSLVDATVEDVMPYVRRWHDAALPVIGTKPFEDTRVDFARAWSNVKYPEGTGPMATMLSRADAADLPDCAQDYESPDTIRLVKLCRELQHATGEGEFFLSCRTASELLKIDRMTVWRRLEALKMDQVIECTQKGTKLWASRYRYTGD